MPRSSMRSVILCFGCLLLKALKNGDLKPFIELIDKNILGAVMPAHVTYTAIDANNADGFSKSWLQNILREELGFQGMV